MTDLDKLARGLTEAGKQALIDAHDPPLSDGMRLVCNKLYAPTIAALERRGLVDWRCRLTPLGLALKQHIERTERD